MDENGNKKCILVVEDDLFLREILSQKFSKEGFGVEGASDANETYKILEEKEVHVILLDLLLPGVNGQDILRKIKKNEKWKNIPVIVASNLDNPEEREQAIHEGAIDYMVKALHTPEQIIDRVRSILK